MNLVHTVNMVHLRVVPDDRRDRNRERRRREFLDAAGRVIDRDGLDGVTIKAIADDLDCAVGTVYRYFASKADLIDALAGEAMARLAASYRTAAATWDDVLAGEDPDEASRVLVDLQAWSAFWASAAVVYADEYALAMTAIEQLTDVPAALLDEAAALDVIEPATGADRALRWVAALRGVLGLDRAVAHARALTMDLLTGWGADRADVEIAAGAVDTLAAHGPMAPQVP